MSLNYTAHETTVAATVHGWVNFLTCVGHNISSIKAAVNLLSNVESQVCALQVQKELGVSIIPYQDTVVDMATTLIQNGIARPQRK